MNDFLFSMILAELEDAVGKENCSVKEIDKLTETAKGIGAKGLAWARIGEDGTIASSFAKFMTEEEMAKILEAGDMEKGDVMLIVADKNTTTQREKVC